MELDTQARCQEDGGEAHPAAGRCLLVEDMVFSAIPGWRRLRRLGRYGGLPAAALCRELPVCNHHLLLQYLGLRLGGGGFLRIGGKGWGSGSGRLIPGCGFRFRVGYLLLFAAEA